MNLTGINDDERKMLDELMARSGHKRLVDLVNEALSLYGYQIQMLEEGASLPYQEHPGGVRKELAVPTFLKILSRVSQKKTGS